MTLVMPNLPATIPRFISAIVVYATDSGSRWAFAHVRKEVNEDSPSFADSDPSTSVARPAIIGRVGASLDHFHPRAISWGCSLFSVMSVLGAVFSYVSVATAADFSIGLIGRSFVSAIAVDKPDGSMKFIHVREAENSLSPKAQTSDIFEGRHSDLSIRWLGLGTVRRFSGGPFCILADCGLQ